MPSAVAFVFQVSIHGAGFFDSQPVEIAMRGKLPFRIHDGPIEFFTGIRIDLGEQLPTLFPIKLMAVFDLQGFRIIDNLHIPAIGNLVGFGFAYFTRLSHERFDTIDVSFVIVGIDGNQGDRCDEKAKPPSPILFPGAFRRRFSCKSHNTPSAF